MSDSANTGEYNQQTTSLWMHSADVPVYEPLTADIAADVCVVGGGIAGLTTAYLLAVAGRSVVVLERGPVGGVNTARTTAHLSNVIDDRYVYVEHVRGVDMAKLAYESHSAAIDQIAAIVREESIECDFERLGGYLFLAPQHGEKEIDDELAAAKRAGFADAEKLPEAPVGGLGPCLHFPNQGQFHPLKYIAGLCRAITRRGGRIFGHTSAEEIKGGEQPSVRTADGKTVTAGSVVVATNSPITDRVAMHTKQAPYSTYVVGLHVVPGTIPRGLYWDTLDPYHYVRLQWVAGTDGGPPHEVLIVGGEDHKTGQAQDGQQRFEALETWAREKFPGLGPVVERWTGMVFESIDGLAFIGKDPGGGENTYVVTGDSGQGMTHGTIAGLLIRDLILRRDNPWVELYEPSRKPVRAAREFIKENLNVGAQYAKYATPGAVKSTNEIAPGTGALYLAGLKKLAVYRDMQGQLHACSAHCPHLGAPVEWNPTEKTWDCTCHGSRFDARGKVFNGPSNTDLIPVPTGDLT